jgi:hypothetical protein
MRSFSIFLTFALAIVCSVSPASAARKSTSNPAPTAIAAPAPLMRTHVSGSGSDSYPCTVAFPCRTLAAALQLTLPGGEIFVLDSADYGAAVIDKAITVTSEGAVAGVLATAGVGITISAGANDIVNLRGLAIDGGNSGSIGIQFISGRSLNVQKLQVRNFVNSGINFAPGAAATLFVSDTQVMNNGSNGLLVASGSAVVNAALNRVTASGNGVGILAYGAAVRLAVTDAVTSNNQYGIGSSSAAVMVRNSTANSNVVGITADLSGIVRIGQSTVTANGTGWMATNGGQVQSYGNNNVSGNTVDGTVTSTVALQ